MMERARSEPGMLPWVQSRVYPWLRTTSAGHMEADMEGTTPAEGDRRLIIVQEIQAGRLRVVEPPRLCHRCGLPIQGGGYMHGPGFCLWSEPCGCDAPIDVYRSRTENLWTCGGCERPLPDQEMRR